MKINMKFGMGVILAAMLLVSMAFVPAVSAQSGLPNKDQYVNSTNDVSIEDAEAVASYYVRYIPSFMENFQGWQEATVEQSEVYYDLDGKKSAYAFNVIENGQYAGYILVSATKDNYPILEFSKGKTPNAIAELTTRSETMAKERANKNKLSIGKARPLYLGATFYYKEYPLIDAHGKTVDSVVVDLTAPSIVDFTELQMEIPIGEGDLLQQQQMKKEEASVQWDALEERMLMESTTTESTLSGSLGYIYDVPNYLWHVGCSPTAAAMVLGYWDIHGYPNILLSSDEKPLIEELAAAMETSDWPRPDGGTWPWDIDNGIETVCKNHGYSNFDASNDYYVSWNEVKTEVDGNRPFVINMLQGGTGSGYSQPYGDHRVTCIGYSDGTEDYVFIHDTWDTENHHYIAFGNWWGAMATWVRP
ncbi:C39 family peptidase [Methanococcoides sp. NM1]|uniref:C39 family peptidase n=1 Tax=Methanococcoides sp. NM1 TaxID=1201013 RepID=UPI0010837B61|nr:C39 family peptidase [Methanococcoides sp. NM1]